MAEDARMDSIRFKFANLRSNFDLEQANKKTRKSKKQGSISVSLCLKLVANPGDQDSGVEPSRSESPRRIQENYKRFERELTQDNTSRFWVDEREVERDEYLREQDLLRLSPIQVMQQESRSGANGRFEQVHDQEPEGPDAADGKGVRVVSLFGGVLAQREAAPAHIEGEVRNERAHAGNREGQT